jgi:hypothetical protein
MLVLSIVLAHAREMALVKLLEQQARWRLVTLIVGWAVRRRMVSQSLEERVVKVSAVRDVACSSKVGPGDQSPLVLSGICCLLKFKFPTSNW